MIKSFDDLLSTALSGEKQRIALAAAEDEAALEALIEAHTMGFADCLLVGRKERIESVLAKLSIARLDEIEIYDESEPEKAAYKAAELVGQGKADILMKGKVTTSKLLKAALSHEANLRTERLLSDVVIFEDPRSGFQRLVMLSDGGVNIKPDVHQKKQIVLNAVSVAHSLGYVKPNVAILAAAEYRIDEMQSTVDAILLKEMHENGSIPGCHLDGPFALDNAVSEKDAIAKGIQSPVAGKADILIVPTIEAGNIFAKGLAYFGGSMLIHVIAGARAPIIICSRTDPPRAKLMSLALAVTVRNANRRMQ